MPLTVMPVGTLVAVTVKLPVGVSASLTVAIVELVAAVSCCRVSAEPAVIVGEALPVPWMAKS